MYTVLPRSGFVQHRIGGSRITIKVRSPKLNPEEYSAPLTRIKQTAMWLTSQKPVPKRRKRQGGESLPGSEDVACIEREVVELGRPLMLREESPVGLTTAKEEG